MNRSNGTEKRGCPKLATRSNHQKNQLTWSTSPSMNIKLEKDRLTQVIPFILRRNRMDPCQLLLILVRNYGISTNDNENSNE